MTKLFKKDAYFKSYLFEGFGASLASFRVIRENKSVLIFYVIPFLLNIIILSVLMYLAFTNIAPLLKNYLAGDAWYIRFLNTLITPILLAFLFVITTMVYGFTGNVLCSPFLDKLSQKTQEAISNNKVYVPFSSKCFSENLLRTSKNLVKMFILIIIISIVSMFLLVIPVVGAALYSVCGYFTTSFILGLQFLDYSLERRKYTFIEKLKITWKFRYPAIGLGLSFLIISMIPILGFLGINTGVMGASIIFEKNIAPTLLEEEIKLLK